MWARRYSKGDYLAVTGLGWVEYDGCEAGERSSWRGTGFLRTFPLPPGYTANERVYFDFSAVEEVVPADEVNELILQGFVDVPQPIHGDGFAEEFERRPGGEKPYRCALPDLAYVLLVLVGVVAALAAGILGFWWLA